MPHLRSALSRPGLVLAMLLVIGCDAGETTERPRADAAPADSGAPPRDGATAPPDQPDAASDAGAMTAMDSGPTTVDAGTDAAAPDGGSDSGPVEPAPPACPPGKMHCGEDCITAVEPTLDEIHDRIVIRSCVFDSCHGGPAPKEGFDLNTADSMFESVGKASSQMPSLSLFEPGKPDESYVIRKLRGMGFAAMSSTGGKATRMPPPPQPELCDGKIEVIEAWIRAGAER